MTQRSDARSQKPEVTVGEGSVVVSAEELQQHVAADQERHGFAIGEGAAVFSTENLLRQLEADRQRRVGACQAAIAAALEQYRCQLTAGAVITDDGRVGAQVMLRAVE